MRIAVIGGAGQVGQEFQKVVPLDHLALLDHQQIDVTDEVNVSAILNDLDCDAIVNLAAFHRTDECETNPRAAFLVNTIGAFNVAREAAKRNIKVCFVSSDYVFGEDDERKTEYTETDRTGPINAYGQSKQAGEALVRLVTANHLIVRTSSIFGVVTSRKGWTFPQMILNRAKAGEPLRVVNDQIMTPTYARDLVERSVALLKRDARGTFHISNAGPCSWWEFATGVLESAGIQHPIQAVESSAFPTKARRPQFSALKSNRMQSLGLLPMRHWREAVKSYLDELNSGTVAIEARRST